MNKDQWLQELEGRHVQEIQLGLSRIKAVAEKINICFSKETVITVAGTNGKGSTVCALETIYHHAGYRVGAYTSPHLIDFNERIRVNLNPISDEALCQEFSFIEDVRGQIPLTYFEMTTLAAFAYFMRADLDVIILEVGLGGRLDATNIVDADLSIITTIDYDHQQFLGNTLESIGFEKAGILRKNRPFIYADNSPPQSIINRAHELSSQGFYWNNDFFGAVSADEWEYRFQSSIHLKNLPKPSIQIKSLSAAMTAIILLQDSLPVADSCFYDAIQQIFLPGRLQYQPGVINVLYDVAHNAQSADLLAQTVEKIKGTGRVHAVFSALKDKDILGLITPLRPYVHEWYPAVLETKRGLCAKNMLTECANAEIFLDICYNSPFVAFQAALNQAVEGDLIIVYGSFFTVSHVMTAQ